MKQIRLRLFFLIVCFLVLEGLLRIVGFGSYKKKGMLWSEINVQVDSLLGYSSLQGILKYTLNNKEIIETNYADRSRKTGTLGYKKHFKRIHLYGCSFVHGYGITDSLSYPYLLQQLRPNDEVKNFGISGHGLLQFYLLLNANIEQGNIPDIAIIHYASFHNNRSINSLSKRINMERYSHNKAKLDSINFPYARLNKSNNLVIYYQKHQKYTETPFIEYSAIVNQINNIIIGIKDYSINKSELATNKKIMDLIIERCNKNNIKLIVASIIDDSITKEMLVYCQQKQIQTIDISMDMNNPKYRLSPTDRHPNELTCSIYSQKIDSLLNEIQVTQ
ncbi:MAG: hypothetical protein KDD21_11805 [Bacteroidetes bacterium]|nr:hypothetical protein [Bacteroidota bacterium]